MKLELGPIDIFKLTYGNKKKMNDWNEFKARNEVASNFINYFKIKIKNKC